MPSVRLRKPLERSVRAGHPWIYRDALEPFALPAGAVVDVLSKAGRFLGRGLSEQGPIAVRVFTTRRERLDEALLARRVEQALSLRARTAPPGTSAYRLLHGEGDRLPGVVCDRYGAHAVLALDGSAARAWQDTFAGILQGALATQGVSGLLLREGRQRERRAELLWGAPPPDEVVVEEHGMQLAASLWRGQKTGLFLDHRESRRRVRELSRGLRVLNLYAYTGGFSVAAGLGGAAHVTSVDSATPALALAERSWALNGLASQAHRALCADVAAQLSELARQGERFDLVIADPPSFAPSEAKKAAALESYAALHRGALGVLADGGYYLAASCSSHVSAAEFAGTLREGARRARAVVQLLDRWGAPPDHPRLLAFPEGDYLKVLLARAHFEH